MLGYLESGAKRAHARDAESSEMCSGSSGCAGSRPASDLCAAGAQIVG
jgi:hypothetical protein